jgi:diguanylate cyclase (GGDEF)-like protein
MTPQSPTILLISASGSTREAWRRHLAAAPGLRLDLREAHSTADAVALARRAPPEGAVVDGAQAARGWCELLGDLERVAGRPIPVVVVGALPGSCPADGAAPDSARQRLSRACLLAEAASPERLAPTVHRLLEHATLTALAEAEWTALEARGASATLHDSVTGLPDRTLFLDRLDQALRRTRRKPHTLVAVLYLDVERFGLVNEGLGHEVGDRLLTAVARRLQGSLRPQDTLARVAGDEFGVLLEGLNELAGASIVAERIHAALHAPLTIGEHELYTTVSIGIALGNREVADPGALLRDAHTAMRRARSLPEAPYAVFDPAQHARALGRLQLETDLRHALERGEMTVFYQPIVSLPSGRLSAFEALVRWHHPRRGLLGPVEFIPLAEETGLIVPLGQWVLERACEQIAAWERAYPQAPPFSVSVNLSAKQFAQPRLGEQILAVLQRTGVAPERLKLEITESLLIDNPEPAVETLEQLRRAGIQLCMDDFGTGFSSLSYLHTYPIDTLKIDKSFVQRMLNEEGSEAIVKSVVQLAHNLHMHVIAEGVETLEQMSHLKDLACEDGQGYYFARPVDAESAARLLAAQRNGMPVNQ